MSAVPFSPDIDTAGHLRNIFEPDRHKGMIDRMVTAIQKFDMTGTHWTMFTVHGWISVVTRHST